MLHKPSFTPIAAAFAAIIGLSITANAATVLKSGDTVGGWTVTFPAGISLVHQDELTDSVTLRIDKEATFTSLEGLVIRFVQSSFSATPEIALLTETVHNQTGVNWAGFDFLVADQGLGSAGAAQFKSPADVFLDIDPFTNTNWSPTKVSLRGGTLAAGATANWGFDGEGSGGDLVLLGRPESNGANSPSHTFDLKEIPIIPLPAAAWTGLSGLVGLGLIAFGKNVRRLLS